MELSYQPLNTTVIFARLLRGLFNQAPSAVPAGIQAPGAPQRTVGVPVGVPGRASWFYWIAGLSLVNSISAFSGGGWRFIFGLGVTQVIDGIGIKLGGSGIALVMDLIVTGIFVLFGVFASKGQTWAFAVGSILFGLDGLLLVLAQDWISVAFHAYVLFRLFQGFQACRQSP